MTTEFAALVSTKGLTAALNDRKFWNTLRDNMIARMRPIFMKSFERGAELGAQQVGVSEKAIGFRVSREFDPTVVTDRAGQIINEYTDNWWQQFEASTQRSIRRSIARANAEGLGVDAVARDIAPLFGEARAMRIAVSETTTLFGQGAQETYRQNGFQKWQWQTVRDTFVDETCRKLRGKQFPMTKKFERAHVGCRCFPSPVTDAIGP